MAEISLLLGYNGSVTVDSATPRISNLRIGTTYSELDATANSDGGKKTYVKGLQDVSIAFDMQVEEGSGTACATVMAAAAGRTAVPVAATCTESSLAISSSLMHVFAGEQTFNADGILIVPITCRPAPATAGA